MTTNPSLIILCNNLGLSTQDVAALQTLPGWPSIVDLLVGNTASIRPLLRTPLPPRAESILGGLAMFAIRKNNLPMLRTLQELGSQLPAYDGHNNIISLALYNNQVPLAMLLIGSNLFIDLHPTFLESRSLLLHLVYNRYHGALAFLLRHASPNLEELSMDEDHTALYCALQNMDYTSVDILLQAGADPNHAPPFRVPPFFLALSSPAMLELLHRAKANFNYQLPDEGQINISSSGMLINLHGEDFEEGDGFHSCAGYTALHCATLLDNVPLIRLLQCVGCSKLTPDARGFLPIQIVRSKAAYDAL